MHPREGGGPGEATAFAVVLPTDDVLRRVEAPERMLTQQERARAARFVRPSDSEDFVAAHVLVRACVAAVLGGRPEDRVVRQRCAVCGGPHGRPWIEGAETTQVSWSHAHGVVAAVVSGARCGIDVETTGGRGPSIAPPWSALTAAERSVVESAERPDDAFLTLWLRKEALVKAGAGSLDEMLTTPVTDVGGDGRTLRTPGAGGVPVVHALAERALPGARVAVVAALPVRRVRWLVPRSAGSGLWLVGEDGGAAGSTGRWRGTSLKEGRPSPRAP